MRTRGPEGEELVVTQVARCVSCFACDALMPLWWATGRAGASEPRCACGVCDCACGWRVLGVCGVAQVGRKFTYKLYSRYIHQTRNGRGQVCSSLSRRRRRPVGGMAMPPALLRELANWKLAVSHHTHRMRRLGFALLKVAYMASKAIPDGTWIDSVTNAVAKETKSVRCMSREALLKVATRRGTRLNTLYSPRKSTVTHAVQTEDVASRTPQREQWQPAQRGRRPSVGEQLAGSAARVRRMLTTPPRQATTPRAREAAEACHQSVAITLTGAAPAAASLDDHAVGTKGAPAQSTELNGCDRALQVMRDAQMHLLHQIAHERDMLLLHSRALYYTAAASPPACESSAGTLLPLMPPPPPPPPPLPLAVSRQPPHPLPPVAPPVTGAAASLPPEAAAARETSLSSVISARLDEALSGAADAQESDWSKKASALAAWRRNAIGSWQSALHGEQQHGIWQRYLQRSALRRFQAYQSAAKWNKGVLIESARLGARALVMRACACWREQARTSARAALAQCLQERRRFRRAMLMWRSLPTRRRFVSLVTVRAEIASLLS